MLRIESFRAGFEFGSAEGEGKNAPSLYAKPAIKPAQNHQAKEIYYMAWHCIIVAHNSELPKTQQIHGHCNDITTPYCELKGFNLRKPHML